MIEELRSRGGPDADLAHDYTRAANRLRDLLLQASPTVGRVLEERAAHPKVRA
jgi:hypothetical protein